MFFSACANSPKGALKMNFRLLCSILALLMTVGILAVHAENNIYPPQQTEPPDRCSVMPKEGDCKANFHIYYFDSKGGKCGELWGCYEDVFSSIEECKTLCEKDNDVKPVEASPSEALYMYLNEGNGDTEIIRGFIAYGADVNYRDAQYHITLLHLAAHYGHRKAVRVLLDSGADINAKNGEGNTPLFAATYQQHSEIAAILIEKGADVNIKNIYGYTPLRNVCRSGNTDIAGLLLSKGADVNARDGKGDTPLHAAVDKGRMDIALMLLDRGAEINAAGRYGDSPLHAAVSYGDAACVKMLIEKGADLRSKNDNGITPLELARKRGFEDVTEILTKYSSAAKEAPGEFRRYIMDKDYFSCEVPSDWQLQRDEEKDTEYKIYEIQLTGPGDGKASTDIFVSYYAGDNEDFNDYKDFLNSNSKNIAGETKNSRENYGPVKKSRLNGSSAHELVRERMVYLYPKSKSDESIHLKEKLYVVPAEEGFYVLHYSASSSVYRSHLPVFERVAGTFRPGSGNLNERK